MTKKISCAAIALMLFFVQCTRIPKHIPTSAPTTFTIRGLERFECYLRHQQAGAPTTKISLRINIKTYFFDNTRTVDLDDQSLTVDPNTMAFPVTIIANTPNDGSTGRAEVNIRGVECSECANGWGGEPRPSIGNCPTSVITTTNPWEYRAARPQWNKQLFLQTYSSTVDFGNIFRVPNVPESCDCTVK